ncbi:uncharacterized protein BJ171DRAFT_471557 [Polychytrium aggregatum]|uniref:uncharacterized protein n=1 Tax=Polychytrium aggregatum TaxID=110093 RepID=UPI0022FDC0BE|nr:uncharacterized protein BJ171DRAFT_471557 [Polychytrium aggregatum]KAI9208528.1 hypothetical protein BJ171DRAFT_471557 [Polychytrium aggregatum]
MAPSPLLPVEFLVAGNASSRCSPPAGDHPVQSVTSDLFCREQHDSLRPPSACLDRRLAIKPSASLAMSTSILQRAEIFAFVVYIIAANLALHCTKFVKWERALDLRQGLQIHSFMALTILFSALYCIASQLLMFDPCTSDPGCSQLASYMFAVSDSVGSTSIGWAYILRLRVMTLNNEPMYAWLFLFGLMPLAYSVNDIYFILSTYGVISSAQSAYYNFVFNLALEINIGCLHILMMYRLYHLNASIRILRTGSSRTTSASDSTGRQSDDIESVQREGIVLIVAIATELALYLGFQVYTQFDSTGLIGNAVCVFLWVFDTFIFCVVNGFIARLIKLSTSRSAVRESPILSSDLPGSPSFSNQAKSLEAASPPLRIIMLGSHDSDSCRNLLPEIV